MQHPIVTQGSAVTKLALEGRQPPSLSEVAGGSSVPKLALPVTSLFPTQAPVQPAVADALRVPVVEAQMDASVEQALAGAPSEAMPTSAPASAAEVPPCAPVPRVTATSIPQQQTRAESSSSPPAVGPAVTERKLDAQGMPPAKQFVHSQSLSQKTAEESSSEVVTQVREDRSQ